MAVVPEAAGALACLVLSLAATQSTGFADPSSTSPYPAGTGSMSTCLPVVSCTCTLVRTLLVIHTYTTDRLKLQTFYVFARIITFSSFLLLK